jgi:hypothetical protein
MTAHIERHAKFSIGKQSGPADSFYPVVRSVAVMSSVNIASAIN